MAAPKKRPYRKRKRAESEEETRRRITLAAVELHGTVGPAATTLTDVAKRAGVSRMTLYNHFPTEADLFRACSGHWASENPFPDPAGWTIADPRSRLTAGLTELYEWYGLKRGMLGNVMRDTPTVPELEEVMTELWSPYMEGLISALRGDWTPDGAERSVLEAMIRLAVDFNTWQLLDRSGLPPDVAAGVMARMVIQATD